MREQLSHKLFTNKYIVNGKEYYIKQTRETLTESEVLVMGSITQVSATEVVEVTLLSVAGHGADFSIKGTSDVVSFILESLKYGKN